MTVSQRSHRVSLPLLVAMMGLLAAVAGCVSANPRTGGGAALQHPSDVAVNRVYIGRARKS